MFNSLTEALPSELAPKGVHVCGIYPSIIKGYFLERAIFRGKNEEDTKVRREQVQQVVSVPVVEKPEDVANAVWDALKNRKSEVLVGSANMSAVANRMFPSLLQTIIRRTFKLKDQT